MVPELSTFDTALRSHSESLRGQMAPGERILDLIVLCDHVLVHVAFGRWYTLNKSLPTTVQLPKFGGQ